MITNSLEVVLHLPGREIICEWLMKVWEDEARCR